MLIFPDNEFELTRGAAQHNDRKDFSQFSASFCVTNYKNPVFLQNRVMAFLNTSFNKVDFILAFAICFSDRTLQLRSLSGLACGEQDLLKTKCTNKNAINSKKKCNLYSDSGLGSYRNS